MNQVGQEPVGQEPVELGQPEFGELESGQLELGELDSGPWVGRSQPLAQRTGSQVFAALFGTEAIATLLESPYPPSPDYPQLGRYSICAGGPRKRSDGKLAIWTPAVGEILAFLRSRHLTIPTDLALPDHLPFTGGLLGWLGYDLAWEIEKLPDQNPDPLPFPVAYWYEPDRFAVLDHEKQELWFAAQNSDELDVLEAKLIAAESIPATSPPEMPERDHSGELHRSLQFITSQDSYQQAIVAAKEYIRRGDIFQTNLSLRFSTQTEASSWSIYQALHQINPSPFASYWRSPFGDVVSCSPERLVSLDLVGWAETRPIAGTRPRGSTPQDDERLAQELRSNAKEQAEHIMLVDLERNDLGRVCEFGTVTVDELLAIEHYSHVMHLVSNVRGKLRSEIDGIDLIQATFPGGTITGCPKVRCMQIIEELEPVRRSLFYGSCGYLDRRGQLDLNILIRTLLYVPQTLEDHEFDRESDRNSDHESDRESDHNFDRDSNQIAIAKTSRSKATVWGQVGAGIVADSEPEREWLESLQKAKAQLRALELADRMLD